MIAPSRIAGNVPGAGKQRLVRNKRPGRTETEKSLADSQRSRWSGFSALVADDGLFFRIAHHASASTGRPFAQAFRSVWSAIPLADRLCLLSYWRNPPYQSLSTKWSLSIPHPRPLIQIAHDAESSPYGVCTRLGHELVFPLAIIDYSPSDAAREIARTLAQVYMYASRQHWRLIVDQIEKPLSDWEHGRVRAISDRSRDKKADQLEQGFLRVYETEIRFLLDRWGFTDA